MARRLFSVWFLSSAVWGCVSMFNSPDPYVPTGGPAVSQGSTSRMSNVPYCKGGERDKRCVFGTDCRITSQGCQVCQCEGLDD